MIRIACIALAASVLCSPAVAQRAPTPGPLPSPDEIENQDMYTIGVGAAFVPDYEGSDDYRFIPAAAIRAKFHGISITTNGPYIYVDVIPKHGKLSLDVGPIAGLRFDSRHSSDDPLVKLLPRRNTAIEGGVFVGVSVRGLVDPYDSLAIHVDVLHDFNNAYKSTIFSPNISFSTPVSQKSYVSLSAAADFVSSRYANYYFGISPQESLLTGGELPVYYASGGLNDWKASLLVNQSITGNLMHGLSIFGLAQYSRVLGDFARSPIVAERGNPNQFLGAMGVAYTW